MNRLLADRRNWDPAVWAFYVDQPSSRAPRTPPLALVRAVGYVTAEFDADGQLHSDGRLYPDRAVPAKLAELRNASEGDPVDPLDRWFVFAVIADTADAVQAADLAATRAARAGGAVDGSRTRRRFGFGHRGKAPLT